jgi:MoxR-like ATPase
MENANYTILGIGKNLNVIEYQGATEFKPYILRGQVIYDPSNDFRPLNPTYKQKSLDKLFHKEAAALIEQAKERWVAPIIKEEKEFFQLLEEAVPQQKPIITPQQDTALSTLFAKSVAEIVTESIFEDTKPKIDKFIRDTYGIVQKQLKVVSERGEYVLKQVVAKEFETVIKLVSAKIPVFLSGPAGCGKNVICRHVAEALGLDFYFSNAITQEYKITGFIDANGKFHETQFFKAFTQGGLFLLDEMDASIPEVLVILNAAISNGYFDFPTGRFDVHPDFYIISAGNTFGTGADIEYTGRYQIDASSLDRFSIIKIGYDRDIELIISEENKDIVSFINDFRVAIDKLKIKFVVSYRAVERLTKLSKIFDTSKSIEIALLRGLDADDKVMIAKNILSCDNPFNIQFRTDYAK